MMFHIMTIRKDGPKNAEIITVIKAFFCCFIFFVLDIINMTYRCRV